MIVFRERPKRRPFELVHNKLVPLKGAESLAGKLIWSVVPFGDDLLIATSDDGLFLYQNEKYLIGTQMLQ